MDRQSETMKAMLAEMLFWFHQFCCEHGLRYYALGGTMLGVKFMRHLASGNGFSGFGVYCWGLALFTFILNLIA